MNPLPTLSQHHGFGWACTHAANSDSGEHVFPIRQDLHWQQDQTPWTASVLEAASPKNRPGWSSPSAFFCQHSQSNCWPRRKGKSSTISHSVLLTKAGLYVERTGNCSRNTGHFITGKNAHVHFFPILAFQREPPALSFSTSGYQVIAKFCCCSHSLRHKQGMWLPGFCFRWPMVQSKLCILQASLILLLLLPRSGIRSPHCQASCTTSLFWLAAHKWCQCKHTDEFSPAIFQRSLGLSDMGFLKAACYCCAVTTGSLTELCHHRHRNLKHRWTMNNCILKAKQTQEARQDNTITTKQTF